MTISETSVKFEPASKAAMRSFCAYCGSVAEVGQTYCCRACEHLDRLQKSSELPELKSYQTKAEYSYADKPEFLTGYSHNSTRTEFVLRVDGLQCASCVHLIEKIPQYFDAIEQISVDYGQALILVNLKSSADLPQLLTILKDWGYEAVPLKPSDLLGPQDKKIQRKTMMRLAVAGAIAGNLMMLSIPIYSGASGLLKLIFLWLQFVLFLPLVFYSALPFYKSAWHSLQMRILSVDLPITLALWAGFVLSTVNLIQGKEDVYFDSTASFIFLILITRYFVTRIQKQAQVQKDWSLYVPPQSYQVLVQQQWIQQEAEQIQLRSIVEIQQGQTIPADGFLVSAMAEVDTSLFSGESLPQIYTKGMLLQAGTKLISATAQIDVQSVQGNTRLGQLLVELERENLRKNHFTQITDRLSQILIATVFSVALIYFLIFFQSHFDMAFQRALALLIIACPCAMAFGAPLTFALALKKAKSQGLLIKNAAVFEKLQKIENIFFDKTGTLSEGHLDLMRSIPSHVPEEIKSIILSLESFSNHPVAFAFRRIWGAEYSAVELGQVREIPGQGVEGFLGSSKFELMTAARSPDSGYIAVTLIKDGEAICYFYFEDQLKADSKSVIQKLQKRFEIFILSGDRKHIVEKFAQVCGISKNQCFSEASPEFKMQVIHQHSRSLMIGDGVNDVLAFKAADVSIAVRSSQLQNQAIVDVILLRSGLQPVLELLNISNKAYKTLTTNLAFALLYNLVAGFFALMGFINPLMAAILMPISSLIILFITYRGLK